MFTVAVLADIHGNLDALDAILADLAVQQYDSVVLAGDLLTGGPQPVETLQRIRDLRAPTILGNADREVTKTQSSLPIARWTREQIGEEGVAYLRELPLAHRITPPDGRSPEDDLLVVHATPTSVDPIIILEPHPIATDSFHHATTPEAEIVSLLGAARANLIVYGHINYASSGVAGGQRLASIGAVGSPSDGDQRAAYALISWDGCLWLVSHRRVPYAYERTAQAIEQSGQPVAWRYAQMIREARWIPHPKYT